LGLHARPGVLISSGVIDLPTARIATLLTEVGSAIYYMDVLQKKTKGERRRKKND